VPKLRPQVPLNSLVRSVIVLSRTLDVVKLSKRYRNQEIFSNLSFRVAEGEVVSLVGPSGSGKTTLLFILASYDLPSSGSVVFNGLNIAEANKDQLSDYRFKVGFVFQESVMLPDLSAMENVVLPFIPIAKKSQIDRLVAEANKLSEEFHAEHIMKRKAALLSTGEKRRVEFIRAILKKPEVFFADEPTANLDEESASVIIGVLQELRDQGIPVVFTVHRDQRLSSIASRSVNLLDYK
jgi:putative ABC transport system ATP-binding protein